MELNNTSMLHGLYGSKVSRSKAVGYCHCHNCHLTVATLKGHKCLSKQCEYLKKHEEHPYWTEREAIKQLKKIKRKEII